MNKHVEFYVNIDSKDKSKINDAITVEHRSNNSKRDFLFVNRYQGKHIPCDPNKSLNLFDKLTNIVKKGINSEAKILVIGFAETATAIGQYVAIGLGDRCVYRTQTTRCVVPGEGKLLEFSEEHSHAPEQYLYGDWESIPKFNYILFVEDEISTGKTILNFIDKLAEKDSSVKFGVASICNWQSKENKRIYKERGIDTFAIFYGELKNSEIKLDVEVVNTPESFERSETCQEIDVSVPEFFRLERSGCIPDMRNRDLIVNEITNKIIDIPGFSFGHSICIIGTEENMYYPIEVAARIVEKTGIKVVTHSTTRSPIDVCVDNTDIDSEIVNKSQLHSPYGEYKTFIYNIRQYDKVIIITDASDTDQFNKDICGALKYYGNSINNIRIIKIRS